MVENKQKQVTGLKEKAIDLELYLQMLKSSEQKSAMKYESMKGEQI